MDSKIFLKMGRDISGVSAVRDPLGDRVFGRGSTHDQSMSSVHFRAKEKPRTLSGAVLCPICAQRGMLRAWWRRT